MYTEHELILLVEALTPEQEDLIYDEYDALIATHGSTTRLTVTVEGRLLDGAHRLLGFLDAVGVHVQRFVEDFVSRADIADRAGVSRQAVGLWVRGERHAAFPEAYAPVAGGIWLFREVDEWLRSNVPSYDGPELGYPSRDDHVALAQMLLERKREKPSALASDAVNDGWRQIALAFEAVADVSIDAPVDRHEHTWSRVALVNAVGLTLVA
jgi:hypothetical protein